MKTYMKSSFYVDFFLFNCLSVCFPKVKNYYKNNDDYF